MSGILWNISILHVSVFPFFNNNIAIFFSSFGIHSDIMNSCISTFQFSYLWFLILQCYVNAMAVTNNNTGHFLYVCLEFKWLADFYAYSHRLSSLLLELKLIFIYSFSCAIYAYSRKLNVLENYKNDKQKVIWLMTSDFEWKCFNSDLMFWMCRNSFEAPFSSSASNMVISRVSFW